jgi:hypothetical protein
METIAFLPDFAAPFGRQSAHPPARGLDPVQLSAARGFDPLELSEGICWLLRPDYTVTPRILPRVTPRGHNFFKKRLNS